MAESPNRSALLVGLLSIATAGVTFVIHEHRGVWPTDFGPWGAVLFATVGVYLVGRYTGAVARTYAGASESGDEAPARSDGGRPPSGSGGEER